MFRELLRIQVAKEFPASKRGRSPSLTFDDAYDSILRVIRTGMQWRHLQPAKVSHITVFKTMHKWKRAGVFETAYKNLIRLYMRQRRPKFCCVDSTFVKSVYGVDCVGRNPTDRGRKATKMTAAVDDQGVPYAFLYTPANHSDMKLLESTLASSMTPIASGTQLFADKGYDSAANRRVCKAFGYRDRIFRRKTVNGRRTHAKRGVVERFFSWIDKYRRLIVRYERHISTYICMSYFACGELLTGRIRHESEYQGPLAMV